MKQQFTQNHHLFLFTDHFFSASRRSDLPVPTSSTGAPVCRRPDNPMMLASVKLCFNGKKCCWCLETLLLYNYIYIYIHILYHNYIVMSWCQDNFYHKPSKREGRQLMFLFEWSVLDSIPNFQEFVLNISFLSLEVLTTLVVFANHITKTTTPPGK